MNKRMDFDRRTLLQILPATVLAKSVLGADDHCGSDLRTSSDKRPYQWAFFTQEEATFLDALMEKIIPADEHSPGAHQARVAEFADLMVSASPDYVKQDWRTALAQLAAEFGQNSPDAWLEAASQHEEDPQTPLDVFFKNLKQMTINGYYSSSIGIHEDLHYQGNTYVAVFQGCDHAAHKNDG